MSRVHGGHSGWGQGVNCRSSGILNQGPRKQSGAVGIRDTGTIPEVTTEQEVPETVEGNRAEQVEKSSRKGHRGTRRAGQMPLTTERVHLFLGLIKIFKHAHDEAPYPFADDCQ